MIEYLANDAGLEVLVWITLGLVSFGFVQSIFFELPRAIRGVRSLQGLTNGRRIFAWFQVFHAVTGLLILVLFMATALDLLLLEDGNLRKAIARLGILGVLALAISRGTATTVTGWLMDRARIRIDDGPAEEIAELAHDTNATAHRIEDRLEGQDE